MVRGASQMGMAGPALVKAGVGEDIDKEALGGAKLQADRYGIALQESGTGSLTRTPEGLALASVCHVLMNSNEFLYVD